MDWIDTKDRMPDVGVVVLITDGHSVSAGCRILNDEYPFRFIEDDVSVEHCDDETTFPVNAYIQNAVTHWMPLPTKPNKELVN